jgi:hypothetical protein
MNRRVGIAVFFVVLTMPIVAMATGQGITMMNNWKSSDRCAANAVKAFPDYTAESLAKRDARMKECLANGNLPPRGELDATPAPAKP